MIVIRHDHVAVERDLPFAARGSVERDEELRELVLAEEGTPPVQTAREIIRMTW